MYEFDYRRANTTADAAGAVRAADESAFLAGGMTLIPTLKQRLARHSVLVDLAGIGDLQGIADNGDAIAIGAMTTYADVASSDLVRAKIPALAALAEGIGDPQVRNRGTIGGSIANNDPAADYPAACLGLDATIVTSEREIAADDFFTGLFETALGKGELITAVRFRVPAKAAYMKFPNPASRYAIVGVFVASSPAGVRVAVTVVGQDGVFRASEAEQALSGDWSADAAAGVAIKPNGLNKDIHASAKYRAHLISVMTKRAVAAAI